MHTRVKATPKQLLDAMDGKMSKTGRRLLDDSLEEYRFYTEKIKRMDGDIEEFILTYFKEEYELLMEIPGVKANSAAVILAEIGSDVEAIKTAAHLASWAGLSPGSYESAGVKKSSRTTRGNKYLKTTLIACGGIAGRSMDPAFSNFDQRLSARGAKMKAVVACGHKLLRIIYKVLSCHIHYDKQKALGLRRQY